MYRRPEPPSETVFLSVVIPVYRSESCLPELARELRAGLDPTGWEYEVILVNDFSPDGSWRAIEELCQRDGHFIGVDLRRNFGQDNAILTGMRLVRGSVVAVMDDDLQHSPFDIPALVARMTDDVDLVYAEFETKHQKAWKNAGSWLNGKIADWVLYKPPHIYLSPFKVIRREVVDMVCAHVGSTPYIDGLLFQCTWRIASIPVAHHRRFAGQSNYTFWRAAGVSARLLFSFSGAPVRAITATGAVLAALGLAAVLLTGGFAAGGGFDELPAFALPASMVACCLILLAGLQILFTGLVGEYACRIYQRVNRHPQTSVRRIAHAQQTGEFNREVSVGFEPDL